VSDDVAVVWLDQGADREDSARLLAAYARARDIRMVPPEERPPPLVIDAALADRVEQELARAREGIAAADAAAAEAAITRADELVRGHPELPNAAWLRAEVDRAWAARFARVEPRDDARARGYAASAAAVDGGRVTGASEVTAPTIGPKAPLSISVVAKGARAASGASVGVPVVRIDGVVIAPDAHGLYTALVAPAQHHLLVMVDDRVAFASWVATTAAGVSVPGAPSAGPTRLEIGDGGACSVDMLSSVRREGDAVVASGITCARWLAVAASPRADGLLVARCERDACSPLVESRAERAPGSTVPRPAPKKTWPTWATIAIASVGAATAATVVLLAAGAGDKRDVESRFVLGGARQE
jgi:hypothetical protein